MKRLFIAEKPELGRAIAQSLGSHKRDDGFIRCSGGDVVTWCFGHLLQLTDPEDHDPSVKKWELSALPLRWPVKHKPIRDKHKQVKLIKKLASEADEIVHAGDPDEEGQLLVDEVLDYINNKKPVKRVLINDLNDKIVRKSLSNLKDNREFYGLYQSALARSVSDQLYGYNLTRAYTLAGRSAGANKVLSVGRVQTPILGLIVRRDRANESHEAHFYFDVIADIHGSGGSFKAKYRPASNTPVDEKSRLIDEAYAQSIVQAVTQQPAIITELKHEDKAASPPLPYNLLNLQADASRKFGLSPDQTLKLTQQLRERHRLITYNRSDCEYLSDEQHSDAPAVLSAIAKTAPVLTKAAERGNPNIKSRAFNSKNVSAHHAIVPTENTADLSKLTDQEAKLYQLIARAYIAQFWPKHLYRETTIDLSIAGHHFRTKNRITIDQGWKRLYKQDADNQDVHEDDADSHLNLEWVTQHSDLRCTHATSDKKQTKPPAKYSMSVLLKDLARVAKYIKDPKIKALLVAKDQEKKGEHGGIGTPATRSAIIERLIKCGFIEEKGKKVISTALGREFHDLLPESATAPDMTALWHEQQQQIKAGQLSMQAFVDGVAAHVSREVERIKADGISISAQHSGPECPTCQQGSLKKRKGQYGNFWSCSAYPECKASFKDKRGKPALAPSSPKKAVKPSKEHACPKCSKGLIRRPAKKKGKFWWGCSGFPSCDFRAFDQLGKPEIKADA